MYVSFRTFRHRRRSFTDAMFLPYKDIQNYKCSSVTSINKTILQWENYPELYSSIVFQK